MKILKNLSYLFVAGALVFGLSSCKKDEEESKKCCTTSMAGVSDKVCEDDPEFIEADMTWEEYAQFAKIAELVDGVTVSCN